MKYLLPLLFVFACAPTADPTQQLFTDYVRPKMHNPDSYEFVRLDSVAAHRISWDDYKAALRDGKSKTEAKAIDNGVDGFKYIWGTYRGTNKLGGIVTNTVYLVVDGGQVIQAKEWNEPLPHLQD